MVIATGRPPDEAGDVSPDARARAATLNIDPGDSLRGTELEAATYLGDDRYVAYVGRFGGEDPFLRDNQNELQLEYRLSRRWSFEATYGGARRGSADIVWTRRF